MSLISFLIILNYCLSDKLYAEIEAFVLKDKIFLIKLTPYFFIGFINNSNKNSFWKSQQTVASKTNCES